MMSFPVMDSTPQPASPNGQHHQPMKAPPSEPHPSPSQQAGSMHHTGMLSCSLDGFVNVLKSN